MYLSPAEMKVMKKIVLHKVRLNELEEIASSSVLFNNHPVYVEMSAVNAKLSLTMHELPLTLKNHFEECFDNALDTLIDETLEKRDKVEFFRLSKLKKPVTS